MHDDKYYHQDRKCRIAIIEDLISLMMSSTIIDIIQVFIMKNDETPWLDRSIMRTTCDMTWKDPHSCSKDIKWNSKTDHVSPDPLNVDIKKLVRDNVILAEDHAFDDDTLKNTYYRSRTLSKCEWRVHVQFSNANCVTFKDCLWFFE